MHHVWAFDQRVPHLASRHRLIVLIDNHGSHPPDRFADGTGFAFVFQIIELTFRTPRDTYVVNLFLVQGTLNTSAVTPSAFRYSN